MATFYLCQPPTPPLLLRRSGTSDEAFLDGKWQPSKLIIDFLFGQDDNVDGPISEQDARLLVPAAFA